jgi:O-antigen/teichoic acid export membrane protein
MNQNYSYSMLMRLLAIAVSSVGTLFLLPLILNTLGEYNFGIWGMVSSITGYLLLLDFGIALACTRYLSIHSDNQDKWTGIISNALLLAVIITLILLLAAAAIFAANQSAIIPEQHQLLSTIIIITLIEVAISIPLRMYMSILRTEVRYFDIGLFEVIRVSLRIGGIMAGLHLGGGLIEIVLIGSAANLVFFVLPLLSTIKRHRLLFFDAATIDKTTFSALLTFSKSTAVSQTAEFLKFRTDSVLIAALIGITAAAHYTIIVFIVMMLTQVLMRFLSYWDTLIISSVGKKDYQGAIEKLFKSLEIGLAISLLALANIIIFGDTFITLWVGESYASLHSSLILLTCILLSISFQMVTTPYFNAIGKQKTNASIDLGEIFIKLLLIIPMSFLFGLDGFIYSSLISASIFGIGIRLFYLSGVSGLSIKFIYGQSAALLLKYLIYTAPLVILYQILLFTGSTQSQAQLAVLSIQIPGVCVIVVKYLFFNNLKPKTA